MKKELNNFAYIDGANLHKGVKELGWKLSYQRFRVWLFEKNFDNAILVSSDGDFYCLANYFYEKNKLRVVISPNYEKCSALLKKAARGRIVFMNNLKEKLARK